MSVIADMLPAPSAGSFFTAACVGVALLSLLLLCGNVWFLFFPRKSRESEPVTRKEFEDYKALTNDAVVKRLAALGEDVAGLKALVEARQDAFSETLTAILRGNEKQIDRLHQRVSALENSARIMTTERAA